MDPTLENPDVIGEEVDDALLPDMMEINVRIDEPKKSTELMDAAGEKAP